MKTRNSCRSCEFWTPPIGAEEDYSSIGFCQAGGNCIDRCIAEKHEVVECCICGELWCATCGVGEHEHSESELYII